MIKEGYPKDIREEKDVGLHSLIWNWIKSPTVTELNLNREILAASLRPKEQDYLHTYWQRQEPQFIRAYTRLLPNLGAESTQRSEASHPIIKNQTNKHTPIEVAVRKLRDVVIEMARKHEDTINRQRRNAPLLVADKPLFKDIKQKITHEALNLILREWISAGKLVEDLIHSNERPPDIQRNTCKKECALPIQYGLPCKCFFYYCLIQEEVISPSLIHPRWFFDGPPYVAKDGWRMRYSDFRSSDEQSEDDSTKHMTGKNDRYHRHGMALLEEAAVTSLDYAKTLPANEREEYAKAFQEFNSLFQNRRARHAEIPTTFVDPIRPKDVKLKKGKRRGLSLREALEKEEVEKRRRRRAKSIEQARLERHNALSQSQSPAKSLHPFLQDSNSPFHQSPELSDQDLSDGPEFHSDVPVHESENSGSDDEIQYLRTQAKSQSAVPPPSFPSSKSRHSYTAKPTPNSETCKSDSDELVDIDKPLSQQVPPPLISLSQNLTASQLPPSTAPIMTCTARGVARKKTF